MSKVESHHTPDPGFEVEITSGGRAYEVARPVAGSPTVSPARASAKARARRRNIALVTLAAIALASIVAWAWLSNPNTNTPPDAIARVNGEYITNADIDRELQLSQVSIDLSKQNSGQVPSVISSTATSPTSVLQDLILRKMKVQDAQKAGVTVTKAEIDGQMQDILQRTGLTEQQLTAALSKRGLTLDDMRAVVSDTYLINKYMAAHVLAGATDDQDAKQRVSDWEATLNQASKVDYLKPAGSGPDPTVGSPAPDFTLKDVNGKDVTLSAQKGHPVMVNFWATWCPPCRSEIPIIQQMYSDTHKDGNYEILGVATQSDTGTIQAFMQEFNMGFRVLPDTGSQVTSLYHVLPIPTTFFIDKDGIIQYLQVGPVDRPLMEKWLLGKG